MGEMKECVIFHRNNENIIEKYIDILTNITGGDIQNIELYVYDNQYNGVFCNGRINRNDLPSGLCAYDFREGDDGNICSLKNEVLINHYGTFITDTDLGIGDKELEVDVDFDYSFE